MERFDVELLYKSPDKSKSVALIVLNGIGETTVDASASYQYEVVSGEGTFVIFDMITTQSDVSRDCTVRIPNGVMHRFEGDLVIIRTSTPAFDPNTVTVVE